MSIPTDMARIVFSGTMPGGEIWQTGYWVEHSPGDAVTAKAWADAAWAQFCPSTAGHTFLVLAANFFAVGTSVDAVTVYGYNDTTGHASVVGRHDGTGPTAAASGRLPDQCCLCVTTKSALAGAHNRGRMYFPASGGPLDSNGLYTASYVQSVCTAVATDMKALETTIGGFLSVILSPTLGTFQPIIQIAADLRPDTQRRRANRQVRGARQLATITRP